MRKRWFLLFLLVFVSLAGTYLYLSKTKKSCVVNISGKSWVCGEAVFSSQITTTYLVKIEKAYKSGDKLWLDVVINNNIFNNKAKVLLGRFGTEEIQITDNLDISYDFSGESVTQNVYMIDSSTVDIINNKSGYYALMMVTDSRIAFDSLKDRVPFEDKEREKRSLEFIYNYRDNCVNKHNDKVHFTKYLNGCDYLYVGSLHIFSK